MLKRIILVALVQTFSLSACAEGGHKPTPDSKLTPQEEIPTFEADIRPVIQARCNLCHNPSSGLPVWENYEVIFAKRDLVRRRVFELRDMPRGNATGMTDEERELVALWIDNGAPLSLE